MVQLLRWMCTTAEDGVLVPRVLNLAGGGGGTLVCRQTGMLLYCCPGGVVLEVEQVLPKFAGIEVRALEVRPDLKVLLPYRVLLVLNREKRDRQCCYCGEVVLAQRGEGNVCHHLNAGVELTTDDRP
jgi:hypothetical protein